jgi:serine/threonine protein kinase
MGVVYEAQDERLPRLVALKFLPEELAGDPQAARRLRREAETIARLNHPNICTIYEIDEHDGRSFIVMERVEGVNLKMKMARQSLPCEEIVNITTQIARALEAAHAQGIVHRDIKPGNIMVTDQGHVKVLDFGLARRFQRDASSAEESDGSTIPGRPVGTANYMAPERILQLPLDGRSDLFSLGVVMYEMGSGRLPFAGSSPSETVTNILEREPTPLATLSPTLPPRLGQIVSKLIEKRPEERYQSASELCAELAKVDARTRSSVIGDLFRRFR